MILLSNLWRNDVMRCMFDFTCSQNTQPGGLITAEILDLSCRCVFAAGGERVVCTCMITEGENGNMPWRCWRLGELPWPFFFSFFKSLYSQPAFEVPTHQVSKLQSVRTNQYIQGKTKKPFRSITRSNCLYPPLLDQYLPPAPPRIHLNTTYSQSEF